MQKSVNYCEMTRRTSFWHNISVQVKDHTSSWGSTDGHIEKYFWVRHDEDEVVVVSISFLECY